MSKLLGVRRGRIVVVGSRSAQNSAGNWYQLLDVVCDCGAAYTIRGSNLSSTKQCRSCRTKENAAASASGTGHPLYMIWWGMNQRCHNPENTSYKRYGARGIYVCSTWRALGTWRDRLRLAQFAEDMGARPSGTSLDRIDNDGPYEPENCRWATLEEQANNRRDNTLATFGDTTMTLTQWARKLGVADSRLFYPVSRHGIHPDVVVAAVAADPRVKWRDHLPRPLRKVREPKPLPPGVPDVDEWFAGVLD